MGNNVEQKDPKPSQSEQRGHSRQNWSQEDNLEWIKRVCSFTKDDFWAIQHRELRQSKEYN